jgi:hypothetical protein
VTSTIEVIDGYRAGACNIGPREIARRRRTGHVGIAAALLGGAALVGLDAPAWSRTLLFVPAAVGASGYIQAATRFCANYGWRGVFNFGEAGHDRVTDVADAAARAADRRKALGIGVASGAIGLVVVLVALSL